MGVQALTLGKIGNAGCHLAQRLAGVIEEAGLLHKVVHTQRAGEAGRAASYSARSAKEARSLGCKLSRLNSISISSFPLCVFPTTFVYFTLLR